MMYQQLAEVKFTVRNEGPLITSQWIIPLIRQYFLSPLLADQRLADQRLAELISGLPTFGNRLLGGRDGIMLYEEHLQELNTVYLTRFRTYTKLLYHPKQKPWSTKNLHTYVEYRAVSGVFQTIDPHPPLHPASVSSLRTKGGGQTLVQEGRGPQTDKHLPPNPITGQI